MAAASDHISQAKKNLATLETLNACTPDSWDWEITMCFYTAVHIVNAHIVNTANAHYRTHMNVANALNPHNVASISKIDLDAYLAYKKLEGLSRRARYLCHQNPNNQDTRSFFTDERHFSRAIKHLDKVMKYFDDRYSINFPTINITCPRLSGQTFNYFSIQ